jgi:hypothetical protein
VADQQALFEVASRTIRKQLSQARILVYICSVVILLTVQKSLKWPKIHQVNFPKIQKNHQRLKY